MYTKPAMLRPGRLDKRLYVPLPSREERTSILLAVARRAKIASGVDLTAVAHDSRTEGFSGADLAALVREAGLAVLRELPRPSLSNLNADATTASPQIAMQIDSRHFEAALQKVKPSVSLKDRERYERLHRTLENA